MGTLTKDGTEVKIVVIHMFVFFQSCCYLELQVLQILKQAHIHTQRDKTSLVWQRYFNRQANKTFLRTLDQLTNLNSWCRLQKPGKYTGGPVKDQISRCCKGEQNHKDGTPLPF